jgi:hypothetical protein
MTAPRIHYSRVHYSRVWEHIGIIALAVCVVMLVRFFDSTPMPPMWDAVYYLDMAAEGITDNTRLVAPFAYRPAAPLILGSIASILQVEPLAVFRFGTFIATTGFILCCYWFARSQAFPVRVSMSIAVALALFYSHVKSPLFHQAVIDIYAYPIFFYAFHLLLQKRFYHCLCIAGIGLFFKEFLLIPILVQAALLIHESKGTAAGRASLMAPLGATFLTLLLCFVLPRLLIPVTMSHQTIDPFHNPGTLWRLITYPLNSARDLNILLIYCAYFLPLLLLLNRERRMMLQHHLADKYHLLLFYITCNILFTMYGGTNIVVFISYLMVAQILLLGTMITRCRIPWWEIILMLAAVSIFNRIWWPTPQPLEGLSAYLEFYGGPNTPVLRTAERFAEIGVYMLVFRLLRPVVTRFSR